MPQKFYLDTSAWMDFFENRADGVRPLGEFTFQFLSKCQKRKDVVLVSNEVINELLTYYSKEIIKEIFSSFKDIIVKIKYTEKQFTEAHSLRKKFKSVFPLADILHAVIARDAQAILISRDKHFEELEMVEVKRPEELL